jgi:hypothetical protein
MPGSARPANAPMPSSNPGGSRGSSAAALGAPGNWPRPSTSFRLAKSQDDLARDPGWRGLRRADLRVPGFQEADLRTDDGPWSMSTEFSVWTSSLARSSVVPADRRLTRTRQRRADGRDWSTPC